MFHEALDGLHAAVDLAQNEKFDCNLGFSHYSLNAVEVFFSEELKQNRSAGRVEEEEEEE